MNVRDNGETLSSKKNSGLDRDQETAGKSSSYADVDHSFRRQQLSREYLESEQIKDIHLRISPEWLHNGVRLIARDC